MPFLKRCLIIVFCTTIPIICHAGLDTLAVAPFEVIGNIEDSDIYAFGLPDAIANDLTLIPGLTLVERLRLSSVLQELKLSQAGLVNEETAPKVGDILGVKIMIVGTVQKQGKEVRVHARAVDVVSSKVIFSVKEEQKIKKFKDIFLLEDNLSQKIVFQLGKRISEDQVKEIGKADTDSKEAFESYSRGFRCFDFGDFEKGLDYFQKAVEFDPGFEKARLIRLRAQKAFEELERETTKMNED